MKKFIGFLIIVGLIIGGFYYKDNLKALVTDVLSSFSSEKLLREKPKLLREFPPKEVEIFHVGNEKIALNITKTGETSASTSVYIMPQISGRITEIKAKLGDEVKKGETLFRLGDSLSTDITNLQYESAIDGISILESSQYLTNISSEESEQSVRIGILTAKEAYENAIKAKEDAEKLSKNQIKSAKLAIKTAENSYEDLKDNINDAKDTKEDLEDKYDDLSEALKNTQNETKKSEISAQIKELSQSITQLDTQIENLKSAKNNAKSGLEQSELGLQQIKDTIDSQLSQLDFAIEAAFLQYKASKNQMDSLEIGSQLQDLGIEGQINQASSAIDMIELSIENQTITSPIDGVITFLEADEENFVAPGQVLAKVESLSQLSVKTSVNTFESELINIGDEVEIENDSISSKGTIISISPTLNSMSKKIDVEISLDNFSKIAAGEFVKITFSLNPQEKIFVPLNSVYLNEGEKIVKIADKDSKGNFIVTFKKIETSQIIGDYIEVTSGLTGNEKIIQNALTFLNEGEKIALK